LERRTVIDRKEAQNPQKIEPDDTEVVPLIKQLINCLISIFSSF